MSHRGRTPWQILQDERADLPPSVLRLDPSSLIAYSDDGCLVPKLSRWVTVCVLTPHDIHATLDGMESQA